MTLFETIRDRAHKRIRYIRTVEQIRRMPLDVAIDLDLDPANAKAIARRAVFGA